MAHPTIAVDRSAPEHIDDTWLRALSDAQLVAAIAQRSEHALGEAYRRNIGPLFTLAKRVLADHQLAEETTQEVFLRLWKDPTAVRRGSWIAALLPPC